MIREIYQYVIISRSGIFDPNYYLLTYPDVRRADVNPLWHYIRYGWKEGRNPTEYFDTKFYLDNNPDVKIKGLNPLFHYIKFGMKEGRQPRFNLDKIFNEDGNEFKIIHPIEASIVHAKSSSAELEKLDATVSIIIPTKNAGDDFEFLMKMLKNQEGIESIEIIVVDSGSQDDTLSIAENYGAKIVTIPPEQFSHSYARNRGAQEASGEYLLFTVQDALPPNRTWLYELLSILMKNDVSAVSCAETPREDADLFYRVISWNHYNFLGVNESDKIFKMPEHSDHISLRQNGQLSDLACLISRELFKEYQYRLNYAEDLDLGIRLIKDGHHIAFLGSTRIIHSHNRTAFYFLKRGYVDNLFLSDIFSDFIIPEIKIKALIPAIIFAYNFLLQEIIGRLEDLALPAVTEDLIRCIEDSLLATGDFKSPSVITKLENEFIDHQAIEFIKDLIKIKTPSKPGVKQGDILLQPLMGYLQITFNYLRNTYEMIDNTLVDEVKSCLFKEYAILMGAYMAYCYLNSSDDEKESLHEIHAMLTDGI